MNIEIDIFPFDKICFNTIHNLGKKRRCSYENTRNKNVGCGYNRLYFLACCACTFTLSPHCKEGKKIFEAYLANAHPDAKIISINDVGGTAGYIYTKKDETIKGFRDVGSNYVEGYYSIGKKHINFM